MKKIVFPILLICAVLVGLIYRHIGPREATSGIPVPSKVAQNEQTALIGLPTKLEIPSISVDTNIEYVGLDEKRNMDVPKDAANAGWYNLGPKPGEEGSAVMAGHLDDPTGAPAVFWDLKKLKEGDEIKVTDENGKMQTFKVTRIESYPFDDFPLEKVFADTSGKYLNLITCDGTFDKSVKNYSQRIVVYSELRY